MRRSLSILVLLLTLPACGGDDASSKPDGGSGGPGAGGAGTGDVTVACSYPAKVTCGALTVHGAPAAQIAMDMCTHDGGTPLAACPGANLLGCCRQSIVENCFYAGGTATAAKQEMGCTSGGGTWSTSP